MSRIASFALIVVSAVLLAAQPAAAVTAPTLYYDFDETGGLLVNNRGTLGGVGIVTGPGANLNTPGVAGSSTPGSGILFNDDHTVNGGWVQTGFTPEQVGMRAGGSGNTNYAASAWFNSAAVPTTGNDNDQMIFGQNSDGGVGEYLHHGIRGTNLHFGHWGADVTGGPVSANTPTHAVFAYTAGYSGIYKDGVLVPGTYEVRAGLDNNAPLIIGRTHPTDNRDFNGTIDDVSIYNDALTLGQIIHLSNGGNPLLNDGIVGPAGGPDFAGIRVVNGAGDVSRVDGALRVLGDHAKNGVGTAFDATIPYINLQDPNSNGSGSHNFAAGGSAISSPKLAFPGNTAADDNDFAVVVNGAIVIETAGDYTFGFAGDDGSQFILEDANFTEQGDTGGVALGNAIVFRDDTGNSETLASTFLAEGIYPFELVFNENGGGAFLELFAAPGIHTAFNSEFRIVGDTEFGGLALTARPSLIPEPTTAVFGLLALGALGIRRRRTA